jgi:WD40 repeat protein
VGGRYSDISEFDAPTGELLRRLLIFESPAEVALSPDGTRVVSARAVDGVGVLACHVIDVRSALTHLWSAEAPRALYASPLFSPRGTHFAVAAHDESGVHPRHEIQFRNASTGVRRLTIPQDPAAPVQQLAFTADGATLLVRTDANTVRLFDPTTGAAWGELAHRGRSFVSGIAVHPRGPVACARTDGTVTLWNAEARERLRTLDWKAGRLVSVAFSPDGALGATGTEDGKVVIWDVE